VKDRALELLPARVEPSAGRLDDLPVDAGAHLLLHGASLSGDAPPATIGARVRPNPAGPRA
jgi:hypothetical protein